MYSIRKFLKGIRIMSSTVQKLVKKKLISPPKFLAGGIQLEVVMGSVAYGVSNDNSDLDIYGFCIPNRGDVFPHTRGEIPGFGTQIQRFEQYQQHHIIEPSALSGKGQEYDFTIYSIVKYFQLCMENNPNMIDSLFVPRRCILYSTQVGEMVRENRKLFLHKGAWHKFKGYAYSQLHKAQNSVPQEGTKRRKDYDKHGYSTKFAYHVVRLISEVEMILSEGDLDLTRNREQLKSIRRGEWSKVQIREYFNDKEKHLEMLYLNSSLQHCPDEKAIKQLLLNCLEHHYGSLDGCVMADENEGTIAVRKLEEILSIINQ
jgi:uncharacterized protein